MVKMKKEVKPSLVLIAICWLIYACSYIGKVNYAANINQVMFFYCVDHSTAGLASTLFFFAYGVGQVINGLFCKKYNIKWAVFLSLIISGSVNFIVAVSDNFAFVQYLWLLNGFSMSILWPCLIRTLSENLSKKDMSKASIIMGTTVATGTFLIYGLSALFVQFNFKLTFYLPAGLFFIIALFWLFTFSGIVNRARVGCEEIVITEHRGEKKETFNKSLLLLCIVMLAFYGVVTNLIKDGLVTWVPSILKEQYALDGSFSIILTLALPAVAIFGNAFAVYTHKKVSDYVLHAAVLFLASGVIIGVVISGLSLNQFILTLLGFTLVYFLVSSSNSLITSIFPLFMKGKVNSGRVAGILNGFCYLGSTISSYGLGAIADYCGWNVVFWVLFFACVSAGIAAGLYLLFRKYIMRKNHGEIAEKG